MNPSEVHAYLESFNNFESQLHKLRPEDFYLNRIQKFLDLAGDPAKDLKIVHVAGTKGKGSTCAFLARILQEAGYKVGLYTSPHLHRVNERIRILSTENINSGDPFAGAITDDELALVLSSMRPFAAAIRNEGNILTYFEVLTVAALCHFARSKTDIVILETGLGGRLDATNACSSSVAVITPISLDHMRILGSTVSQIAVEKAGIIKDSHQKVVLAPQEKEVMDVILGRCIEFGVQPVLVGPGKFDHLQIGLKGRHQIINAAVAVKTAAVLRMSGLKISEEAVSKGLKNAVWPGRFELLRKSPDVIVDCAHNSASAKALAETLSVEYPGRRVIIVLGISEDKDAAAVCRHLKEGAALIILTKASHPRAHAFKDKEARDYLGDKAFEIIDSPADALKCALQTAGPKDVIVVTGSVFLVAEISRMFKDQPYAGQRN